MESRFVRKYVEYSQYLPLIREGKYESVPADFFISGRMENEQSVEVQQTHHVTMVSENSIVPVDVLFQNHSSFFEEEFEGTYYFQPIDMIRDLLTYSNSQLGQLPMEFSDVMLRDYFEPLLKELKNYALQKDVRLTYSLDENNMFLHIDSKRMTQVMYNLVENAMKYMDKQEKQINISIKCSQCKLHIKVEDNGMGIHSEEIVFIFDKFYRAEKSRTSTVPEAGSTFFLVLPLMSE